MDLRGEPKRGYSVRIRGGVGETVVYLPKDAAIARRRPTASVTSVEGLVERDGLWVNPVRIDAPVTVSLDVKGGIGKIRMVRKAQGLEILYQESRLLGTELLITSCSPVFTMHVRREWIGSPSMPKSDIISAMDLRQLEIVQAVAETGSFTGAGRKLHVSQSAISRQILLLEDELNESIFLRVGRQRPHHPGGRITRAAQQPRLRRHQGNSHRHRREPADAERHDSPGRRHDGVHVRVSACCSRSTAASIHSSR